MTLKPLQGLAIIICLILVGCQPYSGQQVGQVSGATAGALIGSQIGSGDGRIAAVAIGTLLGSIIGGNIGTRIDQNDRYRMGRALELNRNGQLSAWNNSRYHTNYRVVPRSSYFRQSRRCRNLEIITSQSGARQRTFVTACRNSRGNWEIVS